MLRYAWLACGIDLLLPSAAFACGKIELQTFIDSAQTLAPAAEDQAAKLLNCPAESAATIQWLAFYRTVSHSPKAAQPIRAVLPQIPATPALSREIALAYIGSYTGLKAKYDSGDPTYRDEPQVYLALGRALMRHGDFADGRSFYATYLRTVRGAYAEEVENTYSYIWEGRLSQAKHDLDNADFTDTPPEYARSIANGKDLVKRLLASTAAPSEKTGAKEAEFTVDLEGMVIKDEMERLSSGLSYHGSVDAGWRHHLVKEFIYDKATLSADEFHVGAEHTISNRVTVGGHIGYLTNSDQHYVGDALVKLRVKNQLWIGGGVDRRPLFIAVPLTTTSLGLLEDRAYLEGGWPGWLTARSAYIRDHQRAAFERHAIDLHQPVKKMNAGAEVLGISALALYEARPQPSPDYESYHSTAKIGLGAFFEQTLGEDWAAGAELQYTLAQRQPFGTRSTERHSGADLQAHFSDRLGEGWYIAVKLGYAVEETGRPAQNTEHRLSALAALELRP